ncbi:hypothetical protein BJX70DRAFT_396256 [Aspergillus crustosus]
MESPAACHLSLGQVGAEYAISKRPRAYVLQIHQLRLADRLFAHLPSRFPKIKSLNPRAMTSNAKYHELHEADKEASESMLGSDTQDIPIPRRERRRSNIGRYLLYTITALSISRNLFWILDTISKQTTFGSRVLSSHQQTAFYNTKPRPSPVGSAATRIQRHRIWVPPSEAYDEAWEDLYHCRPSFQGSLSGSDAAKLPNHTLSLASEPGQYVVELDVFHQLHCLHHLHKTARTPTPTPTAHLNTSDPATISRFWAHLDHCSESLRQSLMCSSDVSTITWVWSDEVKRWQADGRSVHTCRDFGKIQEWAFGRSVGDLEVDFGEWVGDPLKGEV